MSFVVQIVGLATGDEETPLDGKYLARYDLDANHIDVTDDPEGALRFANAGEAFDLWRSVSRAKPLRDDGKPNRPLTAFSIMLIDEDSEAGAPRLQ